MKPMNVLQTFGAGQLTTLPGSLDKVHLNTFKEKLSSGGIDLSKWGVGGAKSIEQLFWEAYQQRGCMILGMQSGKMQRITRLVKIRLIADIFGVSHTLFSRLQFMHDGQQIERMQVPLTKLKWSAQGEDFDDMCKDFVVEDSKYLAESWRAGCAKALDERLGLKEKWQKQHLEEEVSCYTYDVESNIDSVGYPGLLTTYCVHRVTFRIKDPESSSVALIGLPEGQEFATAEGDFNFHQSDECGLPIGTQLNVWTWARQDQSTDAGVAKDKVKPERPGALPDPAKTATSSNEPLSPADKALSTDVRLLKRVELPLVALTELVRLERHRSSSQIDRSAGTAMDYLRFAMLHRKTEWAKVDKIVKSIDDPKYSLTEFSKDIRGFPELDLYLLESGNQMTVSGRTIGDEYQRTIGAFFAIFWLLRLDIDGKSGFSFGVNTNWQVVDPDTDSEEHLFPADKRRAFQENCKWEYFKKLLVDSGILVRKKSYWGKSVEEKVDHKRLKALLVLTAIHDIMKMPSLLPVVQPEHAPYHGYIEEDVINDHDMALSYILEMYPEILPSFEELSDKEQKVLLFTQCDLCFNHGWFVQAEAPPGAIFTKLREVLIRDHKSQLQAADIAFYFIHWLTDLAGAEPTPLGGCEKFVIKFPLAVLNSFLRSFEFIAKIVQETETEVMEQYLKARWLEHEPSPGPLPNGESSIAKMRLLCMAQMNARPILTTFEELSLEHRAILSVEMSWTGCLGQCYSPELVPAVVSEQPQGPAFLVYYGPAFLQNLGSDPPLKRLQVLAEVYRCAREIWPALVAKVGASVIVRIDTIKALSIVEIYKAVKKGDVWLVVKHNENEAFVERSSTKKLNKYMTTGHKVQVLDVSFLEG